MEFDPGSLLPIPMEVSTSDDDEQLESANNTATLFHKVVPPKNTERHQPIDVGFMLQYRFFLKKVMDKQRQVSQRDPSQPKQHQLSFTIQLHSILTNQFGADAFSQLLKYCFFAAGYSVPNYDENVGFLDVVQVCFSFQKGWCEVADCNNLRFVQCAHCRKCICMHHFCSTMFEHLHFDGNLQQQQAVLELSEIEFDLEDDENYDENEVNNF